MTEREILDDLQQIIGHVLDKSDLCIDGNTTASDVDGWNSLTNMQIISDTESYFKIKFKLREIIKLKNVGDFCKIIQDKLDSE